MDIPEYKSLITSIGSAIRDERLSQGLSQESLAEKCGVSRSSLSNLERGHQMVSLYSLLLISMALGLKLKELFSKTRF